MVLQTKFYPNIVLEALPSVELNSSIEFRKCFVTVTTALLKYEGGPISTWPTKEKRKFWKSCDLFLSIVSF